MENAAVMRFWEDGRKVMLRSGYSYIYNEFTNKYVVVTK